MAQAIREETKTRDETATLGKMTMTIMCSLPNELQLMILAEAPTNDLWNGIRHVSRHFHELSLVIMMDRLRRQTTQDGPEAQKISLGLLDDWRIQLVRCERLLHAHRPSCVDPDRRDEFRRHSRGFLSAPTSAIWRWRWIGIRGRRGGGGGFFGHPDDYSVWLGVPVWKWYLEVLSRLQGKYVRPPGGPGSAELGWKANLFEDHWGGGGGSWGHSLSSSEVWRDMSNAVTAIELGFEHIRKVQAICRKLREQGESAKSYTSRLWTIEAPWRSDEINFKAVCTEGKDSPVLRLAKVVLCEDERGDLWPQEIRDEMRRGIESRLLWMRDGDGRQLGNASGPLQAEQVVSWLDDLTRHSFEVKLNLMCGLMQKAILVVQDGRTPCLLP